jgi:hypothetical protein
MLVGLRCTGKDNVLALSKKKKKKGGFATKARVQQGTWATPRRQNVYKLKHASASGNLLIEMKN